MQTKISRVSSTVYPGEAATICLGFGNRQLQPTLDGEHWPYGDHVANAYKNARHRFVGVVHRGFAI